MIVADRMCPCFSTKISIEPAKVEYGPANETAYCERLKYSIYRRMPSHCLNYHAEVMFLELQCNEIELKLVIFSGNWNQALWEQLKASSKPDVGGSHTIRPKVDHDVMITLVLVHYRQFKWKDTLFLTMKLSEPLIITLNFPTYDLPLGPKSFPLCWRIFCIPNNFETKR